MTSIKRLIQRLIPWPIFIDLPDELTSIARANMQTQRRIEANRQHLKLIEAQTEVFERIIRDQDNEQDQGSVEP